MEKLVNLLTKKFYYWGDKEDFKQEARLAILIADTRWNEQLCPNKDIYRYLYARGYLFNYNRDLKKQLCIFDKNAEVDLFGKVEAIEPLDTKYLLKGLSPREIEVLQYRLQGYNLKEIAEKLKCSYGNVITINSRLVTKLERKYER